MTLNPGTINRYFQDTSSIMMMTPIASMFPFINAYYLMIRIPQLKYQAIDEKLYEFDIEDLVEEQTVNCRAFSQTVFKFYQKFYQGCTKAIKEKKLKSGIAGTFGFKKTVGGLNSENIRHDTAYNQRLKYSICVLKQFDEAQRYIHQLTKTT